MNFFSDSRCFALDFHYGWSSKQHGCHYGHFNMLLLNYDFMIRSTISPCRYMKKMLLWWYIRYQNLTWIWYCIMCMGTSIHISIPVSSSGISVFPWLLSFFSIFHNWFEKPLGTRSDDEITPQQQFSVSVWQIYGLLFTLPFVVSFLDQKDLVVEHNPSEIIRVYERIISMSAC